MHKTLRTTYRVFFFLPYTTTNKNEAFTLVVATLMFLLSALTLPSTQGQILEYHRVLSALRRGGAGAPGAANRRRWRLWWPGWATPLNSAATYANPERGEGGSNRRGGSLFFLGSQEKPGALLLLQMAAGVSHVLRRFEAKEMDSYKMDHQLPLVQEATLPLCRLYGGKVDMVPDRGGRVIRVVFAEECPACDLETMRELVHARFSLHRGQLRDLPKCRLSPRSYRASTRAKERLKQRRRHDKRLAR